MQHIKSIYISNDRGTSRSHGVEMNLGGSTFVREEALEEQVGNMELPVRNTEYRDTVVIA
jgi:hypothetical protein